MLRRLEKAIEHLNSVLQKSHIEDLSYFVGSNKRIMWYNFFGGIFRGFGIGIGVTIVTAIVFIILQKIVMLNIPVIGEYIADIVDFIDNSRV